ncbi:hypothetical protein P7C70_g5368, partial [Phenoliferia sp. Uapishka_3]
MAKLTKAHYARLKTLEEANKAKAVALSIKRSTVHSRKGSTSRVPPRAGTPSPTSEHATVSIPSLSSRGHGCNGEASGQDTMEGIIEGGGGASSVAADEIGVQMVRFSDLGESGESGAADDEVEMDVGPAMASGFVGSRGLCCLGLSIRDDTFNISAPYQPCAVPTPNSSAFPTVYPGSSLPAGYQHSYSSSAVSSAVRRRLKHPHPRITALPSTESDSDEDRALVNSNSEAVVHTIPSAEEVHWPIGAVDPTDYSVDHASSLSTDMVRIYDALSAGIGALSVNGEVNPASLPTFQSLERTPAGTAQCFVFPSLDHLLSSFEKSFTRSSAESVQTAFNQDLQRRIPNFFFSDRQDLVATSHFTTIHLRSRPPTASNSSLFSVRADNEDDDDDDDDEEENNQDPSFLPHSAVSDDDYDNREDNEEQGGGFFNFRSVFPEFVENRTRPSLAPSGDERGVLLMLEKRRPKSNEKKASRPVVKPSNEWVESVVYPLLEVELQGKKVNRQTMAEFAPYHRNPQAGHYDLLYICYGNLFKGYGSLYDTVGPGMQVITSHGGGSSSEIPRSTSSGSTAPHGKPCHALHQNQLRNQVTVRALKNNVDLRIPVVLIAGRGYQPLPCLNDMGVELCVTLY